MIDMMTPAQHAAYVRLLDHGSTCRTCRARLPETGRNAELPCTEGGQVYEAYRQALRGQSGA
jgi:hypothetical protein